jgi:hypothetical protein
MTASHLVAGQKRPVHYAIRRPHRWCDRLDWLSLDLLLLLRQCLGAIRRCLRAFGKLRLAHYHYTPTASKRVAPAAVQ